MSGSSDTGRTWYRGASDEPEKHFAERKFVAMIYGRSDYFSPYARRESGMVERCMCGHRMEFTTDGNGNLVSLGEHVCETDTSRWQRHREEMCRRKRVAVERARIRRGALHSAKRNIRVRDRGLIWDMEVDP